MSRHRLLLQLLVLVTQPRLAPSRGSDGLGLSASTVRSKRSARNVLSSHVHFGQARQNSSSRFEGIGHRRHGVSHRGRNEETWTSSARWVPRCAFPTAYLTLLTLHSSSADPRRAGSYLSKQGAEGLARQLDSIMVLAASLRAVELCRRDFVLLLGTAFHLPAVHAARLQQIEGLVIHRVPPVRLGRATLDKMHAWNLTQYRRVLVIDSDAMALQPLDAVFDGGEGTMGGHTHEPGRQATCGIPPERRANGGFYVIEPRTGGYEEVTQHIDANPQFWSMEQTNHTPQQTGTACYFESKRLLRTLPCTYWYDIATDKHRAGTYWHGLCVKEERKGRNERGSCRRAARRLEAHCLWANVSHQVHAIHFKGGQKPWNFVAKACKASSHARFLHGAPISPAIPGLEQTVSPLDDLNWDISSQACLSRSRRQPVFFEASAKPVPKVCCRHEVLVASEWHAVLRSTNRSAEENSRMIRVMDQSVERLH